MHRLREILSVLFLVVGLGTAAFTYDLEARDAHGALEPIEARRRPSVTRTAKRVTYVNSVCGAAITSLASGRFSSVSGSWPVPKASDLGTTVGRTETYSLSQWIGIGSYETCEAALQAGADFYLEGGEVSYDIWYEAYPDYAYTTSLTASAGDQITVAINATSTTAATIVFSNLTTGKAATVRLAAPAGLEFCLEDVEWIAESVTPNTYSGPSWSFDFTGCQATTSSGAVENLGNADLIPGSSLPSVCVATEVSKTDLRITYD